MEIDMLGGDKSAGGDRSGIGTRIQHPWLGLRGWLLARPLISFARFQAFHLSANVPAPHIILLPYCRPPIPAGRCARDGQ
jgi:hypothetical protein